VAEVSHPEVVENRLAAAAQEMLSTIKILPPVEEEKAEASGGRDVEIEPPSE
jgi:hypothetical protein